MKKILVALVALTMTVSAFADGHSMVRLDSCTSGTCDGLDFDQFSDDKDPKNESSRIALNYAMAFAGNFGAGITFITEKETTDGDKGSASDAEDTIGLSFYWNKDGSWSNSCFAAFHYDMVTAAENDGAGKDDYKDTNITLEFGHRYALGSAMFGVTMNWVPSITYAMGSRAYGDEIVGGDDYKTTHINLNLANFAATF